jgi:sortase A
VRRPAAAPPSRWRGGATGRGIGHDLVTLLILTGALLLIDAGLTVLWQEPVSALYTTIRQSELSDQLAALEREAPTQLEVTALGHLHTTGAKIAYLARELEHTASEGSAVGRIRIPRIGADFVLIKGTSTGDLREGPGIYPQTAFPGAAGTTAVAGHRTTFLAPFRHINQLRRGDIVSVDMPYGRFVYSVIGQRIVKPNDIGVIRPVGYSRIVLSACTPLYSAAERLIVFARLVRIDPLGAARSI